MIPSVHSLGFGLLLLSVALAGWQPIDSNTNTLRLLKRDTTGLWTRLDSLSGQQGTWPILVIDAAGRVIARISAVRSFADLCFSRPGVFFVVMAGDSGASVSKSMVVR